MQTTCFYTSLIIFNTYVWLWFETWDWVEFSANFYFCFLHSNLDARIHDGWLTGLCFLVDTHCVWVFFFQYQRWLFSLPEPLRWNKDPLHLYSKWRESIFQSCWSRVAGPNKLEQRPSWILFWIITCSLKYIGNVEELYSIKKSSHLTVKLYFLQYLERAIFPIWIITWCWLSQIRLPHTDDIFKMQLAFSFCAGNVELRRCILCGSSSEQRVKNDYDML